ncbi:uncharacterized protein LOC132716581 [Ruditapes philippinarum]|uniref:uncharacterized protein LOC132716581 n=1 Tax=Ruditapes philippinarum TaxID=129788 RepID=UPI00295A9D8D|nr:uncharacterized protein LOC132716581 [Ruditapes philippinarum]
MVTSKSTSISANILFDEGSQSSFMSEHLAQKLQLGPTGSETLYMSGFGDTERRVRHLGRATVYLETVEENIPINVFIVPEISMPLKSYHKHAGHLPYLKGLKLAHPVSGDEDFDIEILIGADHYWDVIQDQVIRGDGPTAILSKIGYLLSGPLKTGTLINSTSIPVSMMNVITMKTQDVVNLEKFWEVESIGVEQKPNQQLNFEKTREYQDNSITYSNGQYIAKLPWKDDHPFLSSNENISRRRTMNVINRLKKDPELLKKYGDIIYEQEQRGFIEKVTEPLSPSIDDTLVPTPLLPRRKVHYIPHHPVRKDSATTPIRIVYDCSCRSSKNSPSLNECLMNIPPQLNDLTSILLRFRYNKFAVCNDIEKAFLNVSLHQDDRDTTRFFWLSDPNDPDSSLQIYRFKSVLFGATCSPFILNAVIMKHLDLHQCNITRPSKGSVICRQYSCKHTR